MFSVGGILVNGVWIDVRTVGFISYLFRPTLSAGAWSLGWWMVPFREDIAILGGACSGFWPPRCREEAFAFLPSLTSSILGVLSNSRETYKGV